MKIVVLNGSPKGKSSNTFRITEAFLDGINDGHSNQVELVDISKCDIDHCHGCYTCWTKTPGKCVIHDDMSDLIEAYIHADLIIWSFPLYYFGMPSKIKAFLDRLLPTNLPIISEYEDGTNGHPQRYDLSNQRHILISTCGFYSIKGNYDGLLRQFEIMFCDRLTKIICPEGELFRVPELSSRMDEYLSYVKKAGIEYYLQGYFSSYIESKLGELLYPPQVFIEMANADWEMEEINQLNQLGDSVNQDKSYPFLRQMAALYNSECYKKDIVLEMHFTDLGKTYQLFLGRDKCTVETDDFVPYTTRIETPFQLWLEISEGKMSGSEALMKGQYKVLGDLATMIKMDDFFGQRNQARYDKPTANTEKSSNMLLLLLPFMAMWIFMPIDYTLGGALGILVSGLVTLFHFWFKPTPYERIGAFAAMVIGLIVIVTGGAAWQLSLPSFASGLLWLSSSFLKIPVTAYYSCKDYGGEQAFKTPLFIRTNRILTVMWSIAYLLWGVALLLVSDMPNIIIFEILIWAITGLLGLFTAWFAKWYPERIAGGK